MPHLNRRPISLFVMAAAVLACCARPAEPPQPKQQEGRHEYRELNPLVYPVPDKVRESLPGLLNDNIYVYPDVVSAMMLVAYVPDYSREGAVKMAAAAFLELTPVAEIEELEFWIIQIQPEPVEGKSDPRVVVWGVRPAEAADYARARDLRSFLEKSEYLLVDDQIVEPGPGRLAMFPALPPSGGTDALPGDTAAPLSSDTADPGPGAPPR